MILQRLTSALRKRDWLSVVIETLIVIFGVFLGLQLGNWNSARLDRAQGQVLLDLVRTEVANHDTAYASSIRNANLWLEELRYVDAVMQDPEIARNDPTHILVSLLFSAYKSNPMVSREVFDGLQSSGDIAYIRSASVRAALRDYYAETARWQNVADDQLFIWQKYGEAVIGYVTIEQQDAIVAPWSDEKMDLPQFTGDDAVTLARRLSEDPEFQKLVRGIYFYHQGMKALAESRQESARAMLEAIDDASRSGG